MTRDEAFLRQAYPDEADFAPRHARLLAGEPLAYLLGEWDFYDLTFTLTPDCLIPRPDTEHVAEYLITHLPKGAVFADLCTGSGCIAITVLYHRPDTRAVAVDLSRGALAVAQQNARRHGVSDRLTLLCADVTAPLILPHYDWLVSNPPYIASAVVDALDTSVRDCEPRMALDGGTDGLDFYRALLSLHLPKNGAAVFEIGYDQAHALRALCGQYCPDRTVEIRRDYAGNDRVVIIK